MFEYLYLIELTSIVLVTMSDIGDWFKNIPTFTKYWFGLTAALSLIGRFGIIAPSTMILNYEMLKKFQIWRLFTCIFYYPINPATGFHFLVNMYFLYTYSKRLETEAYAGRPSDYFFLLIFNWLCCVIVGLIADVMVRFNGNLIFYFFFFNL